VDGAHETCLPSQLSSASYLQRSEELHEAVDEYHISQPLAFEKRTMTETLGWLQEPFFHSASVLT
jgi:hypothetical protein